jgi:hypothetical protein
MPLGPEAVGQRRPVYDVAEQHADLLHFVRKHAFGGADRCWATPGCEGFGSAESCSPSPSSDAPQRPQNRFSGGLAAPHERHTASSGAPHRPQNFMPAGLSARHREHLKPGLQRQRAGMLFKYY